MLICCWVCTTRIVSVIVSVVDTKWIKKGDLIVNAISFAGSSPKVRLQFHVYRQQATYERMGLR